MKEAELSTERRLGTVQGKMLAMQSNLASSYHMLGRHEQAVRMRQEIYSELLKLYGKQHEHTIVAANNYANSLLHLKRYHEVKSLLRKTMPMARRVLGEDDETTLRARWLHASAHFRDPGATLDDVREAVATLEDSERTARRVMGGAHPLTGVIERELRSSRMLLSAREASDSPENS